MHVWVQELPLIDRGNGLFPDGALQQTRVESASLDINTSDIGTPPAAGGLSRGAIGGLIAAGVVALLLLAATVYVVLRAGARKRREHDMHVKQSVCCLP